MTWFAVDDSFHSHMKLAELESGGRLAEAISLWTLAGSWSASQLTDGFVPEKQLRKLVPFQASKAAAELVRVGLWTLATGGYQFRDWNHYQPTKSEIEAKRAGSVARTRKSREIAKQRVGNALHAANVTCELRSPVPSRPVPTSSNEEVPHDDAPPSITPQARMDLSMDPQIAAAISAYRDGISKHTGSRPPVTGKGRYEQARDLLASMSDAYENSTPERILEGIRSAAECAAEDHEHRTSHTPFAFFAKNVGKYILRQGPRLLSATTPTSAAFQAIRERLEANRIALVTDPSNETLLTEKRRLLPEYHRLKDMAAAEKQEPAR